MKKFLYLSIIFLLLLSCNNKNDEVSTTVVDKEQTPISKLLQGKHNLIKNGDRYLTFVSSDHVMFSWVSNNGFVYNSILPFDKIVFKQDCYISQPYIKFKWEKCEYDSTINEYIKNNKIINVVVYMSFDNVEELIISLNDVNNIDTTVTY